VSTPDDLFRRIADELERLDEAALMVDLKEALASGVTANELLEFGLIRGLEGIGRRFETHEYFVPELIIGGDIAVQAFDLVAPYASQEVAGGARGIVVMGTVRGDVHDIGKNIVVTLLTAAGFRVIDLGVDVPPEDFAETAHVEHAHVVGLSALISSAASAADEATLMVKERCPNTKVIVGGSALTEQNAEEFGADAYAADAWKGIERIRELVLEATRQG